MRQPLQVSGDEGDDLLARACSRLPIGGEGCLRPEEVESLEAFQAAFASADEWQSAGLIEVLEARDDDRPDGSVILALRFRRLK